MNHAIIKSELAHRELARRHYTGYLAYVHGHSRIPTRMSQYIASRVQELLALGLSTVKGTPHNVCDTVLCVLVQGEFSVDAAGDMLRFS